MPPARPGRLRPAHPARPVPRATRWVAVTGVLLLGLGCTVPLAVSPRYDYFLLPDPGDAWSVKISGWQLRETADADRAGEALAPVVEADPGDSVGEGERGQRGAAPVDADATLRAKYAAFRSEHRRQLARELFAWIQEQARLHYVADGPIDHWATLEDTLRADGDDCDGLELLVYNALRELGFADHEVYRAIVYRPSDGQHHMVTLWFEDADDPWVIDPTGAMTPEMLRMSQIPTWVPLKVFDENEEFTVRRAVDPRPSVASR